jgi:16S rRNA (cytosine967-C5)-methyltransferase
LRWEIGLADPRPPDARRLAWQVLNAVEQGAFADSALAQALRTTPLAARDRALSTQLVYGTLAWQGLLDRVVAQGGRNPQKLDLPVRTLLRLALFQLVRLERIPDFAAVDSAVELAKEFKRGAASGLVNALLRRFLREGRRIDLPARSSDLAGYLAAAYSHPRWLVERWLDALGEGETEALLAANNTAAPTVLRANRRRTDPTQLTAALAALGIPVRPGAYGADALIVEPQGDLASLPGYSEGWFAAQGEASQLVVALLDPRPGARVLDACAAPGGKAMAAAERVGDAGLVVAVDPQVRGLRLMPRAAERLGLANVAIVRGDARTLPFAPTWTADAVLVDAPCSGFGTLRQHPEIRWRRTAENVRSLAIVQADLLRAAADRVAPGGALVYATCTIDTSENADVVRSFLDTHPEFTVDDARRVLPPAAHPLVDADGFLQTYPHRDNLDGFFAARLKR